VITLSELAYCNFCPRNCNANRISGKLGYCKTDAGFNISSICVHRGEEPVISGKLGIINVFFSHCNLQCTYCQNHQISRNSSESTTQSLSLKNVLEQIENLLNTGIKTVGFVSPSHHIPQMAAIIYELKKHHSDVIFVYNTNAYDKVDSLKRLEGLIDIYLPDIKYVSEDTAFQLSDARNYPHFSQQAIKEMYRQKGSTLILDEETGLAESGIIIRHLVLPGYTSESKDVLKFIAEEISYNMHISMMAQYFPTFAVEKHPTLNRTLYEKEYNEIIDFMQNIGLTKGWIQELESQNTYRPDFNHLHPFENK